MNKRQFLSKLRRALSKLNEEERKRQLDYYDEMISDMIDEGMSEEAAVERMGSVESIAAGILSEATPEQLKKKRKIGVPGWIGIALGALVLIAAILFALYMFNRAEDRFDDDDWVIGAEYAECDARGIIGIDILWERGKVTVSETDGRNIIVRSGEKDALKYEISEGTLFISTTDDYKGRADLRVFIPEDICAVERIDIVSTGAVDIDTECYADISVTGTEGDVRVDAENAMLVDVLTGDGNVYICADDDEAFILNYATCKGEVSVHFDRHFCNESGEDAHGECIDAVYDHSCGKVNCPEINVTTASGNIKIIDD